MNKINVRKNVSDKNFNLEALILEVDQIISHWEDDASWLSGWRHNYFCDNDGTFLTFDLKKPNEHQCSVCHKIYDDEKRGNAWVTIMRNKTLAAMKYALVVYFKTTNEKYVDFVKETILFYSEKYSEFDSHLKNTRLADMTDYARVKADIAEGKIYFNPQEIDWKFTGYAINFQGPGKIMGQGLSDAVAIVRILFCYSLVEERFSNKEKEIIRVKLLEPAIDFLDAQQFVNHNITLWREVAIQIMKLVRGNFSSTDLSRMFGILDHLDNYLTEEGMWYEGSVHYHFYVAEAIAYLSYFMNKYQESDERVEKHLEKMLLFAYNVSFDNGILPNPNDGWPNVNLKTYLQVFELSAASYPDNDVIQSIYYYVLNLEIVRTPLPIEDEWYNEEYSSIGLLLIASNQKKRVRLKRKSEHFSDTKLSLLRSKEFNVFIKYGVNSLSHAHKDPLTIEITASNQLISKDLSNAGYGSDLVRTLYNTVFAHNSISIDYQEPNLLYTSQIENKNDNTLKVSSNNIYGKNEQVSREVILKGDNQLNVITEVNCHERAQIDIIQHFDYLDLVCDNLKSEQEIAINELKGYKFTKTIIKKAYKLEEAKPLTLISQKSGLKITFETNMGIYLLESAGNPSTESRTSLLFRNMASETFLKMIIEKVVF